MKTELFYFTGTGNTLALAKSFAGKLEDVQITSITGAIKNQKFSTDAKIVGILFPVYAFGLPRIVAQFIAKLEIPSNSYVFGLSNYGGMGGCSLLQLNSLLTPKNQSLQAGFGIAMPSNYTPFGESESEKKQQHKFKKAEEKLRKIAEIIKAGEKYKIERTPFIPLWLNNYIYKLFMSSLPKNAKKFYADDNCISCGICTRICPTSNIILKDSRPEWGDNCELCLACLQWCPKEAIQLNQTSQGKKRYHHPNVDVDDLLK
jgi:ferredoxin